jgi:ABC-2 type transport system permease protein/oleandomycin transport system permease protein
MTSATVPSTRSPSRAVRWAISDALVMTQRNLLHYLRVPTLIVFSTISPVMFVLLFRYVFGGAIPVAGSYVDYLMPGIFIQTIAFGATQTGVGLAEDLTKGMVDRFRSLPMARSAVLAGRTTSDTVRNTFVTLLMVVVGYLVGFRFRAGFVPAVLAVGLVVLFGLAFSWISATIGLAVQDVESVQTFSFLWVLPLTFASSAFVPVTSMPGWLQAFAKVNPITIVVNATRALSSGGPTGKLFLQSLAWIAVMLAVFVPLSVRKYRRTA